MSLDSVTPLRAEMVALAQELRAEVALLRSDMSVLVDRIAELEDGSKGPRQRERELAVTKIVEFMRQHAGLRMTPNIVELNTNLGGGIVRTRLPELARDGTLRSLKRDGKLTMYWFPTEQDGDA